MAGAFGRDLPDDVAREPLGAAGRGEAGAFDSTHANPVKDIWVTADNQILVELKEDEASRPNLFDLDGRTLVFTPDGRGGYSRRVGALEWEEEIGEEAQRLRQSRTLIRLESFDFPFAGRRWDSFYLGPPGVVTFGAPFTYELPSFSHGIEPHVADEFLSGPTISALYRPRRYGTTHVARRTDRIVVTWIAGDSSTWVHGERPEKPARFQAILAADGSVRFNYIDVPFGDGIAGLFPEDEPAERLPAGADLSQSQSRASNLHHEVFRFRTNIERTIDNLDCHLMRTLGDEFDLFVYHGQLRVDTFWEDGTPWAFGDVARIQGCTRGRFKGSWLFPVWIKSRAVFDASPIFEDNEGFDSGLDLFAHEFAHTWLAYYTYDKSGQLDPLYGHACWCHWRREFHTPAPFPWRQRERYPGQQEEIGYPSIMGGNFWVDHGNGRFTPYGQSSRAGFSWLDLYAMGLAEAEEVPDMFILRNLKPNDDPDQEGDYTADKEIISIDQIVNEHPIYDKVLGPSLSQTVFNAGFVYLLEPGQTPSGDMLALHARYKSRVPGHWAHITGGRSQITTHIPGTAGNRPPTAVGTIPPRTLTENGTAWRVNLSGYFSDPDGDPLTYRAGSTDPEVVATRISGSTVTVQPGTAGPTLLTVTATDGRGGLAYQPIEISVEALPRADPSDFTFVPVILDAPGKGKALFTSELTVAHRGRQRAILDYTYTAQAGGGSSTVRDYLEPGQQLIIPNAVEFLRQRGAPIPAEGKRIGSLRVAFQRTDSSRVGVAVRTTTRVPEGRAGLAYPGLPAGEGFDEPVWLCGLRQNEQDRSNVAFQHMGTPRDGPITLRTTLFSGDPEIAEGHRLEDRRLAPGGFYQFSELLKTAGFDNGYVRVERVEGEAPFYAYGVINDQANSDGSFVFPVTASSLEGERRQTLPVMVETEEFATELTLTNFSRQDRTLELAFTADGIATPDETARFTLTLAAGQQRIIPDVIDAELRRNGVEGIGPSSGGLAGALFATAESGDMSGIVVGARTGSPDGRGGQYGVFYTAVPDGGAFTEPVWIYGLRHNRENRTNLALVNTGEVDDSRSTFVIEIYDQYGNLELKNAVFAHVEARRWRQINSILADRAPGITQAYVRIEQFIGNNPFLAYAVVNDGGAPGERSGDGAYLPARK